MTLVTTSIEFSGKPESFPAGAIRLNAFSVLAAAIALVIYSLRHRGGIVVDPDGSALWQGAVMLLEGHGYRYFTGHPVAAWPPLYSLYLALWMALLGPTLGALVIANGIVIGAQAFAWTRVHFSAIPSAMYRAEAFVIVLFLALFVPLEQADVHSQNLGYLLLAPYVAVLRRMSLDKAASQRALVAIAFCVALALTHSEMVIFVVAGSALVVARGAGPFWRKSLVAVCMLGSAFAVRPLELALLGVSAPSPFVGGGFPVLEVLRQAVAGFASFFKPDAVPFPGLAGFIALIVLFAICAAPDPFRKQRMFFVAFASLAAAALCGIFITVWLNGPISDHRHLVFLPLLLVPPALSAARVLGWPAFLAIAVATTPIQGVRVVRSTGGILKTPLPFEAMLSPLANPGEILVHEGMTLIGRDPWEEPEGGWAADGEPRWGPGQKNPYR